MSYKWIGRGAGLLISMPVSYYLWTSSRLKSAPSQCEKLQFDQPNVPHFDLLETRKKQTVGSNKFLKDGSWYLLYFGFTHCAEVCPNTIRYIDQVMQQNAKRPALKDNLSPAVRCAFVSLDPYRETPEKMESFLDQFVSPPLRQRFDGYIGSFDNTKNVAKAWKVYFAAPEEEELKENPEYQIDHSCFIFLVSPKGKLVDFFTKDMTVEMSVEKIQMHIDGAYDL
ncbi:cytochrome c oxidase assembly factor [Perkinsela sp. CCAP 1560/4]|nr:cytochrome c oxidase assembly factor [Perkinsela sp. CCAP 1560/4]|eukprot:KNH07021.1 cytochrome c oxidase assembly factor [Perkinsela sp. CCAP 1560/4]